MRVLSLIFLLLLGGHGFAADLGLGPKPATASDVTLAGDVTGAGSANVLAHIPALSGSLLTALNASSISSGTLATARQAMTHRILASDCAVHAHTGDTAETVLTTLSVTAATNAVPANSVLVLRTMWTYTNSANNKTLRGRIGAAGAGTGGTSIMGVVNTTTATMQREAVVYVRSTSSQLCFPAAATTNQGTSSTAIITPAIDLTANWEIAITDQNASAAESSQIEAAVLEAWVP
jgi:hypothetical protein